jgi:hypothetical protein
MSWAEHVAQMREKGTTYRIFVGKPEEKTPLARPRSRCGDNIVAYLPHERTVETWKPRKTHARIELRVFRARC